MTTAVTSVLRASRHSAARGAATSAGGGAAAGATPGGRTAGPPPGPRYTALWGCTEYGNARSTLQKLIPVLCTRSEMALMERNVPTAMVWLGTSLGHSTVNHRECCFLVTGKKEQPLCEVQVEARLAPGRRHRVDTRFWAALTVVPSGWGLHPDTLSTCLGLDGFSGRPPPPPRYWVLLQGEPHFFWILWRKYRFLCSSL